MATAEVDTIAVEVVVSPVAGHVQRQAIVLPAGASVADALRVSGLLAPIAEGATPPLKIGVWGQRRPLDHLLRDRDRVELCRPLQLDPKDARRQRQRQQRSGKR